MRFGLRWRPLTAKKLTFLYVPDDATMARLTYWRAAASSSPVVAISPGRRSVLMLRHMALR